MTQTFLDFGMLSSELRILPTKPPWPSVAVALERLKLFLENGTRYPELSSDAQGVTEYARLVRTHQHLIADALHVGAVIGHFAPHVDFEHAVIEGLRTVSRAGSFQDLPTSEIAAMLAKLAAQMRSEWPQLGAALQAVHDERSDLIEPWSVKLQALREEFRQTRLANPKRLETAANNAWRSRRGHFLSGFPETRFDPTLDDLFCRVAKTVGPAAIYGDDVDGTSLMLWSNALHGALTGTAVPAAHRAWLAVQALWSLHWLTEEDRTGPAWAAILTRLVPEELDAVNARLKFDSTGPRVLLVVHDFDSGIAQWKVPKSYSAIAGTAARINSLLDLDASKGEIPALERVDHLFVEDGVDQKRAEEIGIKLRRKTRRHTPTERRFTAREPSTPNTPMVVVAPSDSESLMPALIPPP